ncbi:MAG: DUF4136 domain-containing protein [Myxococcota bacterium]
MRLASACALVGLLLLSSGCQTVRITTDYDTSVDFSSLHSWAFEPREIPASRDPRLDDSLVRSRVRAALESELALKGYVRAVGVPPDFLVDIHLALERSLDVRTVHHGTGRGWGRGDSETIVREVEEGSLIVDFMDPGTGDLLWRGMARAPLRRNTTPAERNERVRETVRRMLEEFPPPPD